MILSVIIPCYNHGQYLQEAIDSILAYKDQPIEIIIIDDGSTDPYTIHKIEELKNLGLKVIQQKNSGLAKTRNAGIAIAKGKYILPVDADNKIKVAYIEKALKLLEANICDIVYAKPHFFGDVTDDRKFTVRQFIGTDLIFGNYIDACAIYKKEVWIKNNGYDAMMPFKGVEDWEFWLSSYFNRFRFHFIDEELFDYRILQNSMIAKTVKLDKENRKTLDYLMCKYGHIIINELAPKYSMSKIYENDLKKPLRSILKYMFRLLKLC